MVAKDAVLFTQCSDSVCGMVEMGRSIRALCTYSHGNDNFMAVGFVDAVEVYQLHVQKDPDADFPVVLAEQKSRIKILLGNSMSEF